MKKLILIMLIFVVLIVLSGCREKVTDSTFFCKDHKGGLKWQIDHVSDMNMPEEGFVTISHKEPKKERMSTFFILRSTCPIIEIRDVAKRNTR